MVVDFEDVIQFYFDIVVSIKEKKLSLTSPLDAIVFVAGKGRFAYVDNRKGARKYNYDFWDKVREKYKDEQEFLSSLKDRGVREGVLYSVSQCFPDFLFRARLQDGRLRNGSLLELKDSKGGSIASFNSTLPTRHKSLDEIDVINGHGLVGKIASLIDGEAAGSENYRTFERRCFYLVRTHNRDIGKCKVSIVDGSFFETVSKGHLINEMFLNILRKHLNREQIDRQERERIERISKEVFSHITDQTIIAASQVIERASVRPRLRIMAEVHPEGNPHNGKHYPEIEPQSLNLIIREEDCSDSVSEEIEGRIKGVKCFSIEHKRNGPHKVFQLILG